MFKRSLFLTSSVLLCLHVFPLAAQEAQRFTLKECIAYGLKNHKSIDIAENSVRQAQHLARESLSAYLPNVNLSAGLDDNLKLPQTIIPAGTFGPGSPEQRVAFGTQYNSSMVAQLDQKVYDQSLLTGLKARQPNIDLAALQLEQSKQSLIYNIASSYFQIMIAQKQLQLLEHNKRQFERILNVTQLQAEQGVAKRVDIKQVQVNLNNVTAQMSVVQNNLTLAKNTLKNNIGLSQSDSIQIEDTARWLTLAPALKPSPLFDFKKTVEYRLQDVQLSLYDINRKSIRDMRYPTLSVFARYGTNGYGQDLAGAFDPLLDFSTIGLKLSWNIFGGLRQRAMYAQAAIDLTNARLRLQLNEESQTLYFENATAQVNRSQIMIRTNKGNMELANEVYENTSLQYREGLASLSDLLNAELSFREAQNNYVNSLLDYYLADLDVHRANGTLEEYFSNL